MKTKEVWYEKETFGAFWERGYRNQNISSMGGPSFEVAEIVPALPTRAKVLDLGCGEGRNAFFLAGQGCEVTAVDRSEAGINKLLAQARKHGYHIKGVVQDIVQFPLTETYDLVMAHGVLYYLENPVWKKLLTKIKQHTRPGGFNIFTLFVYNEQYPCGDEIQCANYKHSFHPNELQEFYKDWTEHRYDQYVKWDAHPGIPLHYHPIEKLVSQKPMPKLHKKAIDVGCDIREDVFLKIDMGISQAELIEKVGNPRTIERMDMRGVQFAICRDKETDKTCPTTEGYCLELWYYGRYVIYVANGEVTGRAIHTTPPIRLHI